MPPNWQLRSGGAPEVAELWHRTRRVPCKTGHFGVNNWRIRVFYHEGAEELGVPQKQTIQHLNEGGGGGAGLAQGLSI